MLDTLFHPRIPTTLTVVLLIMMTNAGSVSAGGFPTPQAALTGLENAYSRKDIEAAVAAKDFVAEARNMLKGLMSSTDESPEDVDQDAEILASLAETLELSFRVSMQEDGFPDFGSLSCKSDVHETIADDLVVLRETCHAPDGSSTVQYLFAARSADGWRIAGLTNPLENS